MRVSLNWIRDFVDPPPDLDPHALAERFTRTTAEIEGVEHVAVRPSGLIAARVLSRAGASAPEGASRVVLDVGGGERVETVTAAKGLGEGDTVVFAPPGASIAARATVGEVRVAGAVSSGMILPGEELGIAMAQREAVFLPPTVAPGEPLDAVFEDDWVIEIDNKSITHRPDLWGHYGIAREIAAMFDLRLKPYPGVPADELADGALPVVPVTIEDAGACPRYSALRMEGVRSQPAPLWMQLRLGHVGLRPIDALVDLTNFVMLDLGQPMHAFDAGGVDRIEVARAKAGERFTTLDGVERHMPERALMIQTGGRSVAIAGVMGGLSTEVTGTTRSLLLESANFDGATIRRCASALGLRTDASARFEKSLDPLNTVAAIRRFVGLARAQFPNLTLTSRLSDCFPDPPEPVVIRLSPRRVERAVGRSVPHDEIRRILEPLEFQVAETEDGLTIRVPTFRATRDVTIEVDLVEEVARFIGYDTIQPVMPAVTMRRFEPHALHELEQRTLDHFTARHRYHEIHRYVWTDSTRLARLGIDPGACISLRNPTAAGQERLRRHLMPNLLGAVSLNRFHWSEFRLIEVGSVFRPGDARDREQRRVALVVARRGKRADDELVRVLKHHLESWGWVRLTRPVTYAVAESDSLEPWAHPHLSADVIIEGATAGRVSVLPARLRRALDDHLSAWSVAWAELRLNDLAALPPVMEPLGRIPAHPRIELDFSFLVPASTRYADVAETLSGFSHVLLERLSFVDAYQGSSVGLGLRSLTIRAVIAHATRTLVDADVEAFRAAFETHLTTCGYKVRA